MLLLGKQHRVKLCASLAPSQTRGPCYNSKALMVSEEVAVEHSLHLESNLRVKMTIYLGPCLPLTT